MDGKLGRVARQLFRRQGLADASERVRDGSATPNSKLRVSERRAISPPPKPPNRGLLKSDTQRLIHRAGLPYLSRAPFRRRREKKRSPRGRDGATAAEDNIWRLARFGGEDPARGPARRS